MVELTGVIPAAGRGVRAYPYTDMVPKSMLEVDGVPLVRRNVELLRDQLGIRTIRIVVGHRGEIIRDYFGDGAQLGVDISYVHNPRLDLELAYSIHLGTRDVRGRCCVILADECYVDTNHRDLLRAADENALATCAFIATDNPKQIRKNYVATVRDDRIVALEEKPRTVTGSLMGTGTYLLHPDLVARLAAAYGAGEDHGPRDWTSWLGAQCEAGALVRPFVLRGRYVNVNSRDDLNYANYLVRDRTFATKTASLVYIVDHETQGALRPVAQFADQPGIAEVVVTSRRELPELAALREVAKVRSVVAPSPHVDTGELVKLGIAQTRGDILVLAYSDDTFVPPDVQKLLVYLRDADMVVGTRTTRQMIEQGANMRGLVRLVHVSLAKLVELLWWRFECRFTDICCVYRAFWRSTWEPIRPQMSSTGAEIFPEMVLEALRARKRIIEIPVNYYNRDVDAPRVRSRYQSPRVLGRVLRLILRKRLRDLVPARWRSGSRTPGAQEHDHRRLEREWQDTVGHALLDLPHGVPGTAAVWARQFDRIADVLRSIPRGAVVEVGCGKGHLLRRLREKPWLADRPLVGLDLSRAVFDLPAHGLAGVEGDGEALPFRDATAAAIVFDGALHHLIDYPAALRDAVRVLAPGGYLVVFEPVSSAFSRLMHRLLDPIVFRKTVYESPIDQLYKPNFREDVVRRVLGERLVTLSYERSDFLAYPFTGCYAGSMFGRNEPFMRRLMALEDGMTAVPVLGRLARALAWRFTIVAVKPPATAGGNP